MSSCGSATLVRRDVARIVPLLPHRVKHGREGRSPGGRSALHVRLHLPQRPSCREAPSEESAAFDLPPEPAIPAQASRLLERRGDTLMIRSAEPDPA